MEQIVGELESGRMPLEDSLKAFAEGVALARHCARYLDEAERRVELLLKDEAGLLKTEPFTIEPDEER